MNGQEDEEDAKQEHSEEADVAAVESSALTGYKPDPTHPVQR